MTSHASFKPWLALSMGALAVFSAGCAGANTGNAFESPVPQSRAARSARQPQQKLYVTNVNGSVFVYSVGKKPQLLQTITNGVPRPYGVWVNQNGIVYVVNLANDSGGPSLSEYTPGAFSPFFQITSGVLNFGVVAVDANGNVYLSGLTSSYEASYVNIYSPGASTPSQTLQVPTEGTLSRSESLSFDPAGNLLVGVAALPKKYNSVLRLASGSQQFTTLGLKRAAGGLAAADAAGNIYVGGGTRAIDVYLPGTAKPKRVIRIPGGHLVTALTVAADGTLYVGSESFVYVYSSKKLKLETMFATGLIGGLVLSL